MRYQDLNTSGLDIDSINYENHVEVAMEPELIGIMERVARTKKVSVRDFVREAVEEKLQRIKRTIPRK